MKNSSQILAFLRYKTNIKTNPTLLDPISWTKSLKSNKKSNRLKNKLSLLKIKLRDFTKKIKLKYIIYGV